MLGFKAARSEFVYSVQDSLNEISPSCKSHQWLVEHTVSIWVCWNDRDQRTNTGERRVRGGSSSNFGEISSVKIVYNSFIDCVKVIIFSGT